MQLLQVQLRQGTEQSAAQIQELQAQIAQLDGDQQASARRHTELETELAQEKERADRCVYVRVRVRARVCLALLTLPFTSSFKTEKSGTWRRRLLGMQEKARREAEQQSRAAQAEIERTRGEAEEKERQLQELRRAFSDQSLSLL